MLAFLVQDREWANYLGSGKMKSLDQSIMPGEAGVMKSTKTPTTVGM
jgi:hypothetical protein